MKYPMHRLNGMVHLTIFSMNANHLGCVKKLIFTDKIKGSNLEPVFSQECLLIPVTYHGLVQPERRKE